MASDKGERRSALSLIRVTYQRDLGHVPEDGADPDAVFIVATTAEREVAGVLRLLPHSLRPFDFEEYVSIAEVIPSPRRVGLLGRLSIRPEYRRVRRGQVLQLGLLRCACAVAADFELSDLLLYSPPEYILLYQAALFKPMGLTFKHPVAQCEMSLLRLDLDELAANRDRHSATARFLIGESDPDTRF